MGVSAVSGHMAITPMPVQAGTDTAAAGLSKQDQLAVLGARPAALRGTALAAASLKSLDPTDPAATGSSSGQGALDTYL